MKRARYASIFIVEAILLASSLSTATLYNPIRDIDKVTQYFETSLSNSEDMIKEIELSKILGTPLFKGFSTIEKKSNIISEDIDNIFNSYIFDGGALDRILGLVTKELKSAKNSLYDTDSLDYAPTGLIIKFKQGGTNEKFVFHGIKEKISKLLPSTTDFSIEPVFKDNSLPLTNTFKIIFPESIEDPEKIITAFKNNPAIEYIEPDYVYMLTSTYPNDPYFSYQWALNQSNDHDIDAPEAWDYERGNGSITVAVIDTGVDYYHPDLSSNIWINTNETPGNGVDDDGNGYVDDVRGWNFVTNDNLPFDDSGHGTHCAGIIGAVGNNGIGVSGVCWNCSIMPVKCFIGVGTTGIGFASTIARGIVYAADNGADVISMSFGAYADSQLIKDAIEHAYNKGVVLVAAAGNDDTLLRMYPAAYPEVIAVAATNQTDGRAYFSNWGSWIDVAAPGDGIYSTASYTNYGYKDGTSMACAYASGLAALIKSQNDSLSNEAIRTLLRSGAESVSSNSYKYIGVGRINANDSLHMIADVVARLDDGLDDSIVSGNVTIFGTASGNNFSSYTVYYGSGIYPSSWNIISSSSSPVENGVLAIWNTLSLPDGTYTIKLSVAGDNSYSYTDFAVLTLNNYASKLHVGGSGAGNFSSIQEAIYNAGDGDTIYVHPGMYSESIVVDRSVTIVGEDRDSTIVTQSFSTSFPPLPTFYVSHDGVVMNNLSIFGAIAIVCEDVKDITISNNTISSLIGITLVSSDNIAIEHNIISNATSISGGVGIVALPFGIGALFDPSVMFSWMYSSHHSYGGFDIIDNQIVNCTVGIAIVSADSNNISDNTIMTSSYNPACINVLLLFSSNNELKNNVMKNGGVFVYDSSGNDMNNNVVNSKSLVYLEGESHLTVNNAGQVILVDCNDITVENLTLSNVVTGIELLDTTDSTVYNNTISSSTCGICVISSQDNLIQNNSINYSGIAIFSSGGNTINNNYIENSAVGISVPSVQSALVWQPSESEIEIMLTYGEQENIITNNNISNVPIGIIIVSNGANTIEGNIIEASPALDFSLGIALISLQSIQTEYSLGNSLGVSTLLTFGGEYSTISNNVLDNLSIGILAVSNANRAITGNSLTDVSFSIISASISTLSIGFGLDMHMERDLRKDILANINIVLSGGSGTSAVDSNILERSVFGIISLSGANDVLSDNSLNNTDAVALLEMSVDSLSLYIDFERHERAPYDDLSNLTYNQTVHMSLLLDESESGGKTIEDNTISSAGIGILALSNADNTISGNNLEGIPIMGMAILSIDELNANAYIEENNGNTTISIQLSAQGGGSSNIIEDNTITSGVGIVLITNDNNAVSNNTLSVLYSGGIGVLSLSMKSLDVGFVKDESGNVSLDVSLECGEQGSTFSDNKIYNLSVGIASLSNADDVFDNNIVKNATVALWYASLENFSLSTAPDFVNISLSSGDAPAEIKNNIVDHVKVESPFGNLSSGILVMANANVTIENNVIGDLSNTTYGESSGILLVHLDIYYTGNSTDGTLTLLADKTPNYGHVVKENIIYSNGTGHGISLWHSGAHSIYENTISNTSIGIYIPLNQIAKEDLPPASQLIIHAYSNNSMICHNNLINNNLNAFDECTNTWNLSYPYGGNYWSDYTGNDIYRGVNQDIPGSDGIGDAPYNVSGDNDKDFYPLMYPMGKLPPIASFEYSPSSPTIADIVHFTDTSIDIDGNIINWTWDFGDENTSYEQNPQHQYTYSGTYTVNLTIKDNDGYTSSFSKNITIEFVDIEKPEISNVSAIPSVQEINGYVNITCKVTDNVAVNEVKVNITYPDGSYHNLSMNGATADIYYLNQTYSTIGTYHYFIWANDTSGNSNVSNVHTFIIQDTLPPSITDHSPSTATTGDSLTFNVSVVDNIEVSHVYVEYWYGTGTHANVSMNNVAGEYWEKTITVDNTLEVMHYFISAVDSSNNWNFTQIKNITIEDNDKPSISDILATPEIQEKDGYVNITCEVTDNIEVDEVRVNITYPDGSYHNLSMTSSGGDIYYLHHNYSLIGVYNYSVYAVDTSGNGILSSVYNFTIIPKKNLSIHITKPKQNSFYLLGYPIKFIHPKITIVIGKIDIEVKIRNNTGNTTVKFYLDEKLKETKTTPAYSYTLDDKSFGRKHTLKVVASDSSGDVAQDSITFRLFNFGMF